jgi:hypothetical protein
MAVAVLSGFVALSCVRDTGFGGPHHDEVIALLAAGAKERAFDHMVRSHAAPFHVITAARDWHAYTRNFSSVSLQEIRADVMVGDKHPPLAFWFLNRWLSLFSDSGYDEAVWLIRIQIVCTAAVLSFAALRLTGQLQLAAIAFVLFLFGNSAVYTSIWLRQYALFALCYSVTLVAAAEATAVSRSRFLASVFLLAIACLAGMMTQYTFATMSAPIHVALVLVLVNRNAWRRLVTLLVGWGGAGVVYMWLMPGVLTHTDQVADQFGKHWQWYDAIYGVPQMYVPMPSNLPAWLVVLLGVAGLILPFGLGFAALLNRRANFRTAELSLAVPLAGLLGAGALQFFLVSFGYFPGWATSPHHLCALWMVTVLSFVTSVPTALNHRPKVYLVSACLLAVFVGMQILYAWHCHQILPRVNVSYIAEKRPDLVVIDNMARGYVLQITDVMESDQQVLVTDSQSLSEFLRDGALASYPAILYFPMDVTVQQGKPQVLAAAKSAGWQVQELPVVHHGLYEAFLFKSSSMADSSVGP